MAALERRAVAYRIIVFRKDSRIHHRGRPDMCCNRCFLLARAVGRFQRFARLAPEEPRRGPAERARLVHRITRRAAWRPPLPGRQERVARETMAELRAGRAVQLFVTDFPRIKFKPSVLAFDYRAEDSDTVDFIVSDPDDPAAPGVVHFDPRDERFHPAPLRGVSGPSFRACRQYYSPFF